MRFYVQIFSDTVLETLPHHDCSDDAHARTSEQRPTEPPDVQPKAVVGPPFWLLPRFDTACAAEVTLVWQHKKKGRGGLQTRSILCLEQLFSRSFRRDHCESGVAELDYCQKCMQWDQVLEPKMQEFLGTVRTECLVLDPKYWRHPDDAVCKRFPTDVGGVQLVCKPCSVEYQPEFRARSGNHLPARHLSVVINVVICLFASIDLTQWCSAMLVLVCF